MQQLSLLPAPSQAIGERSLQGKWPERDDKESFKASLSQADQGFESGSFSRVEPAVGLQEAQGILVNAVSDVTRNSFGVYGTENKSASVGTSESGVVLPVERQSLPYSLSSGSISSELAEGLAASSDVGMGAQSEVAIETSSDQAGQGLSPTTNSDSNAEYSLLTGQSPLARSMSQAGQGLSPTTNIDSNAEYSLLTGQSSLARSMNQAGQGLSPTTNSDSNAEYSRLTGQSSLARSMSQAGQGLSPTTNNDSNTEYSLLTGQSPIARSMSQAGLDNKLYAGTTGSELSPQMSEAIGLGSDQRSRDSIYFGENDIGRNSSGSNLSSAAEVPKSAVSFLDSSNDFTKAQGVKPFGRIDLSINDVRSEPVQSTAETISAASSASGSKSFETSGLGILKDSDFSLPTAATAYNEASGTLGSVAASPGLTKEAVSSSSQSSDARLNYRPDQPPLNAQLRPSVNSLGLSATNDGAATGVDSLDLDASFKSSLESAAAKLEQVALAPKLGDGPKAAEPSQRPYVSSLGLPVTDNEWANQLSQKLMWMSAKNIQSAELHLNPADMGPIDIKIQVGADQSTINFNTPNQSVRELLEANIHRLRDMLNTQADNNGAEQSFSNNGQSQSNNNNGGSNEASHQELSGFGSSTGELSSSESQLVTASKKSVSDSAVDTYV